MSSHACNFLSAIGVLLIKEKKSSELSFVSAVSWIWNCFDMSSVQGSFIRQNTPFPKDLKTRHVKTPPKSVDGHVIAHNPNTLV